MREAAVLLLNHYGAKSLSRSKWLKHPAFTVTTTRRDDKGATSSQTSVPLRLEAIEHVLGETGSLPYPEWSLTPPQCPWLDASVQLGRRFYRLGLPTEPVTMVLPLPLGPSFPLRPALDREGVCVSSIQLSLQQRILQLRSRLIDTSAAFDSLDWIHDLRAFLSDLVSLIDMTLHQLYIKAEYDPLPTWAFSPARLGPRHGVRLADKLRWVHEISHRSLDDSGSELSVLASLKAVRNHLQHFDPPCFCFSIEDAVGWLNAAPSVAMLAIKIRRCLGSPPSFRLLELLVAPLAAPSYPRSEERLPQPPSVGYASSTWP